jgi:hypothetical protein
MKLLKLLTLGAAVAGAAAMAPERHQGAVIVGLILVFSGRMLWRLWTFNG